MSKISIVIPIYNASQYMEECMKCVRNQTMRDIEVILVDDGSTDGSSDLCDQYAQEDNRIKVIHQINKGVSAARNAGIELATGDFIGFSDADDCMELDMYETLYTTAMRHGSDFTAVGIWVHMLSGRVVEKYGTGKEYVFNRTEAIKWFLLNQKFCYSCYCHLIKADLCKSTKFDEKRKMNEDRLYTFEILLKAEKICCNDVCKYHYILRENSATAGGFSEKRLDVLDIADRMLNIVKDRYPDNTVYAEISCLSAYIDVYKGIIKDSDAIKIYQRQKDEMHHKICGYSVATYKQYYTLLRWIEIFIMQKSSVFYDFLIHFIFKSKRLFYKMRDSLT